jgi:hypothetical protein
MLRLLTRRRSPLALTAATAALALSLTAAPARGYDTAAVRADADWTLTAQFSDGAIANYIDRQAVWPYLGNYASLGLTRARQVTGDRRYSDAAWKWLLWYQSHQDASGYVTDYVVKNGVLVSTGDMDSTDAYAGTFLLAVRDAWRVTGDVVQLRKLRTGISNAVGAIESTQDADGLTWAKPTWHVKYLMDQAETYGGLRAAVELAVVLGDVSLSAGADADSGRMKTGFAGLWNASTGAYDWAVHSDGTRQATTWSILYPDALEEVWPVAFGLSEGTTASTLVQTFAQMQPSWAIPALSGYWPVAGWAFARTGDAATADAASASIRSAALAANRAWPFTTGNAGQLVVLETGGPTT